MTRKAIMSLLVLLSVATCALWITSYYSAFHSDFLFDRIKFEVSTGDLIIGYKYEVDLSRTGGPRRPFTETRWMQFPLLGFVVLLAAYPVSVRLMRWRLRKAGMCVNCSYDLTGNVSGICPECGKKIDG